MKTTSQPPQNSLHQIPFFASGEALAFSTVHKQSSIKLKANDSRGKHYSNIYLGIYLFEYKHGTEYWQSDQAAQLWKLILEWALCQGRLREQKWSLGAANRSPRTTSGIIHFPGHPITNDILPFPSQLSLYCVISKITLLLITSCTSVQVPHNKWPSTKWDIIIMNCSCHSVIRIYFRQIHSFISETQTENVTRCQHLNISWYSLGNVRNDWTIDWDNR